MLKKGEKSPKLVRQNNPRKQQNIVEDPDESANNNAQIAEPVVGSSHSLIKNMRNKRKLKSVSNNMEPVNPVPVQNEGESFVQSEYEASMESDRDPDQVLLSVDGDVSDLSDLSSEEGSMYQSYSAHSEPHSPPPRGNFNKRLNDRESDGEGDGEVFFTPKKSSRMV